MLRAFGPGDIPAYSELYRKYFPEEAAILLADPAAIEGAVRRAYRLSVRFVLALLRLAGRPILDLYAVEADGRLAGVTFVFYDRPVGHISSVVVDAPYRGRGFARRMVAAAEASARRRGCRHTFLEVLEENVPAIRLYESMGYRRVRRIAWFARETGGSAPALPEPPTARPGSGLRPFRRSDAEALVPLAEARRLAAERSIRPVHPGQFRVPPSVVQTLGGATEAWVHVGPGGRPDGFVRASTSGAMGSGHLTAPLWSPDLGESEASALFDEGLAWFRGTPIRRVVCEAPEDDVLLVRRLADRGFRRGLGLHTMAKPLG